MKKIDLRTLTADARKELKRVTIRMFKSCKNRTAIGLQLGISRVTVNNWIAHYLHSGELSEEKKRGRPVGSGRRLSSEQEQLIQNNNQWGQSH